MRSRYVLLLVALAGLGTAAVLRSLRRQERALSELQRREAENEAASGRLEAPLVQIAAVAASDLRRSNALDSTAGERPVPVAVAPSTPEISVGELHKRYEGSFRGEAVDAAWAGQAKSIADAKLSAILPSGSSIRGLECRATMCRLETAHKDYASYVSFVRAAFTNPDQAPWNAESYSAPLNDNPADGVFVTYIAREGRSLSIE
jgi:hypothetical protein